MLLQYFYFLLFLNLFQPTLPTNPSTGQFILEKIDKFHGDIKKKCNGFYSNFDEKIGIEMSEQLGNSILLKREFSSEIKNAKDEVEKYLRGEKTFQMIFNEMNALKLEDEKLAKLKELQKELNDKRQKKSTIKKFTSNLFGKTKKQLKLVNFLIESHELVNKFVDEMIVELRVHRLKEFLNTLEHHINEQKRQLEIEYNDFFIKYSDKYYQKIEKVVETEKKTLQDFYKNFYNVVVAKSDFDEKEYLDKLHEAIFHSSFLEKLTLNIKKSSPLKILIGNLNNAVDELPNKIGDLFEDNEKQEFDSLHAKMDNAQLLNIASNKLLERIKQIIESNPSLINGDLQSQQLAEIHWLTEFIVKKLIRINRATQVSTHIPIPNMTKAMEMEELPEELELKNIREKMDPKEKAILIAQNMLFIEAQFNKVYKFTYGANQIEKSKNLELYEMITKEMTPKSIGEFFYQNYMETIKEYKSESETEMSPKNEHHNAASSSTNARV